VVVGGVAAAGATLGEVVVGGVETAGAMLGGVVVDEVVMGGAALVGVIEPFMLEVELDGGGVSINVLFTATSEGEEVPSLVNTSENFEPTAGYLEGGLGPPVFV